MLTSNVWDIRKLFALLCSDTFMFWRDLGRQLGFAGEEAEPREINALKFPKHCPPSPSPLSLQPVNREQRLDYGLAHAFSAALQTVLIRTNSVRIVLGDYSGIVKKAI